MHEQEFERSVQKKMEELSFTPSAPVWERVQAEIREKKDRRRMLLWLLPISLVLLGGGWWWMQNENIMGSKGDISKNSQVELSQPATERNATEPGVTTPTNSPSKPPEQLSGKKAEAAVVTTRPHKLQQPKNLQKPGVVSMSKSATPQVQLIVTKGKRSKRKQTNEAGVLLPATNHQKESAIALSKGKKENQPIVLPETTETATPHQVVAAPLLLAERKSILPDIDTQTLSVLSFPVTEKAKKRSAWQWSVNLQYGVAGMSEGTVLSSTLADRASSPNPNNNNVGGGFSNFPTPVIERGSYFSSGFHVRRKLTSRFAFATGLNYASYSQRQRVGETVSRSSLSGGITTEALQGNLFYRPNSHSGVYNNRYQLLSVPFELQLNPFRKLPLQASAGLDVGYLFAGKELQFDTTSRLYYAAKPDVRRLQFVVKAAVHYRLAKTKQMEIMAGPQLNYHLTSLRPYGQGSPGYLYAYSLGLQLRLKQ